MSDVRPLRICLVTPSYAPDLGGLASIVGGLAHGLEAIGCRVEVATQVAKRLPRGTGDTSTTPVHRFANLIGGRRFGYSPQLTWWLRRNQSRFDIIHVYSYHAPVALVTALTTSRPLVFTPTFHGGGHSPLASAVHLAYRRVSGIAFRRSSAILCGSRAERDALVAEFPRAAERTTVIPFALESRGTLAGEPFESNGAVVLSAGRLDDYKRNDTLIAAMQYVEPTVRLIVCGDGPDRERLVALRSTLGLDERVELCGYVGDDELARWRATASVVASLSSHESFGLSLIEGAVTGAALVLSDIGPHREVVELVGAPAEFVASDAPATDVAAAINAALQRGRSTTQRALPSWTDRARETLTVYEKVLTDRARR